MRNFLARRPPPQPPALQAACVAPHSALYFQPDGVVKACCATGFNLGRVFGRERASLRAIWEGSAVAAQRAALEGGSYAYGCQECELSEATGGRHAATAYHFDRFAPGAPHPWPRLMDFALSNRCNLQCVMCNGGLSSSIRAKREHLPPLPGAYDDRFFDELAEFLPHLERTQFKGGEPFLARENRRVWEMLIAGGLTPEMTVTTNATMFNDNVARYVTELRMHPIVSVDAMDAALLESIRVGVVADRLWANVDRYQEIVEHTGAGMTLSFCLMATNWAETLPFLGEADRRGLNCHIVFVNQPHQYDLLRLPHAELVEISGRMRALEPDFRTPEPRRAWEEVLERIRAHIEHPVELLVRAPSVRSEAVPLESLATTGDPGAVTRLSAADQAELGTRLARDGDRVPLVVEAEDGIVVGVEDATWASWLGAAGWVGHPLTTLEAVIGATVGPVTSEFLPSERPGIDVVALRVQTPGGEQHLRVHLFVDEVTGRTCGLIVADDPARSQPGPGPAGGEPRVGQPTSGPARR